MLTVGIFSFHLKQQIPNNIGQHNQYIDPHNLIANDLKWEENTAQIVKKANACMELLRNVASFGTSVEELKDIYSLFVRSQLQQSAVVWHSSLTEENKADLERVQKSALKIIMGGDLLVMKELLLS